MGITGGCGGAIKVLSLLFNDLLHPLCIYFYPSHYDYFSSFLKDLQKFDTLMIENHQFHLILICR